MDIPYDDNNTTINMDEKPCQLEMGFNTTLVFKQQNVSNDDQCAPVNIKMHEKRGDG